jgi:hypothetical protein
MFVFCALMKLNKVDLIDGTSHLIFTERNRIDRKT